MNEYINSTTRAGHRVLLVYASERSLYAADTWHALFGWEVVAKKQWYPQQLDEIARKDDIERFDIVDALGDFFMEADDALLERYNQAGSKPLTEPSMAEYVSVMYKRKDCGPYLNELKQLQETMEASLRKILAENARIDDAAKNQKSFFKKKREESARIMTEAMLNIDRITKSYVQMLKRAIEIYGKISQEG